MNKKIIEPSVKQDRANSVLPVIKNIPTSPSRRNVRNGYRVRRGK